MLLPRALAGLLLCVALPLSAQDWKGQGRLSGKVTDAEGNPIAGAKVKLDLPERGGGTTITTNKDGKWALGGIAAGNWQIDFEAEGYARRAISVPLPAEAARLNPIVIALQKAGPKPTDPAVVSDLDAAEAAFKDGRYAEARAGFTKLLAELPDQAVSLHQRIGLCAVQEKDFAGAVASFEQVLAAQPENQQMRAIAAQAALEGGLVDKGRTLLAGLDESTITNPDVFFNMGVNFLNANAPDDAIRFFGLAIARDAAYVDGYYRRGLAFLQTGRKDECRADFEKVVALAPDTPMGEMANKALESLK